MEEIIKTNKMKKLLIIPILLLLGSCGQSSNVEDYRIIRKELHYKTSCYCTFTYYVDGWANSSDDSCNKFNIGDDIRNLEDSINLDL